MRHNITLYLRLLQVQLHSQLQYRFSFLLELLATMLTSIFEFGALALVLQRFETIQGWTVGEVAFLYGLVELSFGIMDMIFSGFDPPDFGQTVRKGTFDQLLLRPINITMQVLGSRFIIRRFGKIISGTIIFIYALNHTNIIWTPFKISYIPVIVISMVAFFGGLFIIGSTITFWTVDSIEFINIFTYGGSFLISHPMHIYNRWLRHIFTYLVPAIFLVYYPALLILDKPDPLGFPSFAPYLAPPAGFSVLLVAYLFWGFGIRHYQSTGS
ncbi:MAG TPA: ABC-2 family transporter protein [Anaerolineae bacterium]|nr:ABC-2 family transporter protein [Anaerolineae bacterium]